MTLDEARRTSSLLRAYDKSGKVLAAIEREERPYVRVELYCRKRDDDEEASDYETFSAPRDLVIKMLKALRADALSEMQAYGIEA